MSNEYELVDVYNVVDFFVIFLLEENLFNIIMEVMVCGVFCIGFNVGGILEMIDYLYNGYVV